MIKEHGAEKVKILVKGKWVEKPRTLWVLEKLYMMAVGGNTVAAKEYMERQAGKSEQPIGDVKDDGTISITLDR